MTYLIGFVVMLFGGGTILFQFLRNKSASGLLQNATVKQAVATITGAEAANTGLVQQAEQVVQVLEQQSTTTIAQKDQPLNELSSTINSIIVPPTK